MSDEAAEPVWLDWRIVQALHADQITRYGGAQGVRDIGLIQSALARPTNKWHYENPDLFVLAAAYGFGIAKNHGFEDGNKRTAFLALYTFLGLNGYDLDAPEEEVVRIMEAVADGSLGEPELAEWVRKRSVRIE